MFLSKDFIETADNLVFAVVEQGLEQNRVLCFLRYIQENGVWKKLDTGAANAFLQNHHPCYLFHSESRDADLHAVAVDQIRHHHCPRQRLQTLLAGKAQHSVERDLQDLCVLFQSYGLELAGFGVTGSLLIGAQNETSDIDLVIYDRTLFMQTRAIIRQAIADNRLQALSHQDWLSSFHRRGCCLDFASYIWHEKRKYNKALINGRKFDISLLLMQKPAACKIRKMGKSTLQALIRDDRQAYDYPARFLLTHPLVKECLSYTATYTGQAIAGERVEISGLVEQMASGEQRIIVGSSREADGEFIRVMP